jgi:acyl carrier protein
MLDREAIRQKLTELMEADTGETYTNIDDDKNLRTDLGLDSVDVVSIVSQVERHFRIRLSQQDLEKLVNVGDLLDLLQAKLQEAEAAKEAA